MLFQNIKQHNWRSTLINALSYTNLKTWAIFLIISTPSISFFYFLSVLITVSPTKPPNFPSIARRVHDELYVSMRTNAIFTTCHIELPLALLIWKVRKNFRHENPNLPDHGLPLCSKIPQKEYDAPRLLWSLFIVYPTTAPCDLSSAEPKSPQWWYFWRGA